MMRKTSEVCKMFNLDRNYLMRLKNGLLPPSTVDSSGLKTALYDDAAIERLWMIVLLHKELGYKLEEVGKILDDPGFDRNQCLGEQIDALQAKVEHLKKVITVAEAMRTTGLMPQDIMDNSNMTVTDFVEEFARNIESVSPRTTNCLNELFCDKEFNASLNKVVSYKEKELSAESDEVQNMIKCMARSFKEHLGKDGEVGMKRFGEMLCADGLFAIKIDEDKGEGVSAYVGTAITKYCSKENSYEENTEYS